MWHDVARREYDLGESRANVEGIESFNNGFKVLGRHRSVKKID